MTSSLQVRRALELRQPGATPKAGAGGPVGAASTGGQPGCAGEQPGLNRTQRHLLPSHRAIEVEPGVPRRAEAATELEADSEQRRAGSIHEVTGATANG